MPFASLKLRLMSVVAPRDTIAKGSLPYLFFISTPSYVFVGRT